MKKETATLSSSSAKPLEEAKPETNSGSSQVKFGEQIRGAGSLPAESQEEAQVSLDRAWSEIGEDHERCMDAFSDWWPNALFHAKRNLEDDTRYAFREGWNRRTPSPSSDRDLVSREGLLKELYELEDDCRGSVNSSGVRMARNLVKSFNPSTPSKSTERQDASQTSEGEVASVTTKDNPIRHEGIEKAVKEYRDRVLTTLYFEDIDEIKPEAFERIYSLPIVSPAPSCEGAEAVGGGVEKKDGGKSSELLPQPKPVEGLNNTLPKCDKCNGEGQYWVDSLSDDDREHQVVCSECRGAGFKIPIDPTYQLIDDLREIGCELLGEWSWKRGTSTRNDRVVKQLEDTLDRAKAYLENNPKHHTSPSPSACPTAGGAEAVGGGVEKKAVQARPLKFDNPQMRDGYWEPDNLQR